MSANQIDSDVTSPIEGLSLVTSHCSTYTSNTRATTPEEALALAYRTILISADDQYSIKLLEAAFVTYEPFETCDCAFCGRGQNDCACLAWETRDAPVPSTKKDFLRYLDSRKMTALTLQKSLTSYLLAISQHVPLGMAFNEDQKTKCSKMDRQLEDIKDRIKDLTRAAGLLKLDGAVIPLGLTKACGYFERLLANCLGNARENHVCLKLNYMLTRGK